MLANLDASEIADQSPRTKPTPAIRGDAMSAFAPTFTAESQKTTLLLDLFTSHVYERDLMTQPHDTEIQISPTTSARPLPLLSNAETPAMAVLRSPTCPSKQSGTYQTRQPAPTGSTPGQQSAPEPRSPRVRLMMSVADTEGLAELLCAQMAPQDEQCLLDQLWLRTILIEQRKRIRRDERAAFAIRADRLLAVFDP